MSAFALAFNSSQKLIYNLLALPCSPPVLEPESSEYAACRFTINQHAIVFRAAKITPTKVGQFVTLWKRVENGPIEPLEYDDLFDFVVVCVDQKDRFGQFVFPKSVLLQKGILTHANSEGKRAFRVYPSWDHPTSKQAQKTQEWQTLYFYEFSKHTSNETNLLAFQEIFK